MAYSTGVCNLLVLNVPLNYSTSKLKSELEEIGGQGTINEIKQLKDSCFMLVIKSIIAQRKLLLHQLPITFGGEDFRLEIRELEDDSSGTNDKNAIYTYDAPDSKTQNVLIYLSKSEEHKNSLITELRKYNAHLSDISPLAMMIQLSEGHGYKVDQTIIKKTVIDFIGRFSSWTEVLDSVSPANDKHIKSVLSQYQDKCLCSWPVGSSTILVTGPRKSVEKIENLIRNHLEHTTYKSVETILFDPQETPAAVLKFVLNDATAKRELGKICVKFANVVVKNERGQVQIHFSPKQKNFSPAQKGNVAKAITDFLEKFVSKNRKFDKDKIKIVIKDNRDIFKPKPGSFFIQLFSNSSLKITGRIDMVKKKLEEIDYEMDCETEEEELPADIFIAQRQCEVWKTVEENCKKEGFKISISSSNEKSKIIYKGLQDSITRARINLGEICESLISLPVSGLSSDQLEFIKRCKESQKNFKTEKNILDSLYKIFQSRGVRGSLSFQPSSIVLITANEDEWQRGNRALKESVVSFEIPPVLLQSKISYAKYLSDLKKYFDSSPVYVNYQRAVKKIKLVCFLSDLQEIRQQIETFDDRIESIEYVKKCYPMSEYVAQHIRNQCQIEKAKTIELAEEGRQAGLLITYDKEDSDTVEMRLDELQQEITSKDIKLTGYSLFEYLNGEGKAKLSGIEQQTNCSIFLKSSDKVGVVKGGNILNERCDAILNSTDAKLSLSGQMSRALIQKYGQNVIADCIQTSEWLIPMQLCVCSSLKYNLPWKYIFNIVPPNDEQELKSAIKNLFVHANRLKITSLALPAIGTGTVYGRGSYFALKSSYSVSYTGQANIKYIFLAEVITGDYTQGRTDYKTAPEKDSTGMKYDSCVDNVSNPTIFVVFKDASAYPLYLITFQ